MAIKYGNIHVDSRYKPVVLPNLFFKTWMVPGVTYQDVSTTGNGEWVWHKPISTGAAAPGKPGRVFDDEDAADDLVNAVFNNNYQKSKRIFGVQTAGVSYPVANENLALAVNEVTEGKNLSGLACLITEGTAAQSTAAITKANFDDQVLAVRKEIVDAKGIADVVLCSTAFFKEMLGWAGTKYVPSTNEMLLAAAAGGQVGSYLGMNWIECNALSNGTDIKYFDHTDAEKTVEAADLAKVDFIMYDHNALGIGDNFTMVRLKDSERFAGVLAQTEDNVAYRVLNADMVRVRKHV